MTTNSPLSIVRGDRLPTPGAVLNSIRQSLEAVVLPTVTDQRARVLLQMTDLMLRNLISREALGSGELWEIIHHLNPTAHTNPTLVESRLQNTLAESGLFPVSTYGPDLRL